jgi:PadR family transcriptional regulator PadR
MKTGRSIIEHHLEHLLFDIKRGFLQFVVLSLIAQGPKYAYEIKRQVYQATGGAFDIDLNNLYKKLRALEKEEILKSSKKPSAQGANRKYYALTPFGNRFFSEALKLMRPVIGSFYGRMQNIVPGQN